MFRNFQIFFLTLIVAFFAGIAVSEAVETPHIVIDGKTGSIISQYRANDRWHPASLTKLMTAYVTFRAIANGEIEEGSPVVISTAATKQPPSRMGYKKGVSLRIDTALKIIIIKSANDVSLALAEAVAGNLKAFVDRMNSEAKRLGLANTSFVNSNGLHDVRQVSSARDMALLSAKILTEFPQYAYMFEAVAIETPVRKHFSYNLLLERFPGTTGLKTGFVCAAGYNLAVSAERNGQQLIAIVLGRSSQTDRAVAAARLLTESFGKQGTGSVFLPVLRGAPPVNMRPILCTQEARAARYDPTPGNAVIKSEFLKPRAKSDKILSVRSGGVDASASSAFLNRQFASIRSVPVPEPKPNYDAKLGKIILPAIGSQETGDLAVPTQRPR
ncbi:MAG: D-alanyl-D-alanine carboxypeptidase family protein [Rhizobiaceae bacterium]|nr:D-alanyl-D-alanine carboxypeptidase family protein [Rhizobiaceae bacterium]